MAYPYCPLCGKEAGVGKFYCHFWDVHRIDFDTYVCACGVDMISSIDFAHHALDCRDFMPGVIAARLTGEHKAVWQQKFLDKN